MPKKSTRISLLVIFSLILIILGIFHYRDRVSTNDQPAIHALSSTNQNALHYVFPNDNSFHLPPNTQSKLTKNYLRRYFSPWHTKDTAHLKQKVKTFEALMAKRFITQPGYGENRQPYTSRWIKPIINNMKVSHLTQYASQKGLSIRDTNVRMLPTMDPSFDAWNKAGEGYPFDYLQYTYIYANTPVLILNTSKDGLWYLIKTNAYIGWVRNDSIAFVDRHFIKQWENQKYIVITKEHTPAFNHTKRFALRTHVGILYPLIKITPKNYTVLSAVMAHNKADTTSVYLPKDRASTFPLPLTPAEIATIINNDFIGDVYSWGSFNGHHDCSATIMDLMSLFGIYLPRSSSHQILATYSTSVTRLNNFQKEQFIIKHGIPFLTLLHSPGHVLLYIGHKNKHVYVLQSMWGLKTRNLLGKMRRSIVGQAVITPLNFGEKYINVTHTHLDTLDKIALLTHLRKESVIYNIHFQ